jgi:hypothetical protein
VSCRAGSEFDRSGLPESSLHSSRLSLMLVATRNLIVRYGREEVRLIAGRTRLVDGHDIAKAHPEAFERIDGTSRHARERIIGIAPDEGSANGDNIPVRRPPIGTKKSLEAFRVQIPGLSERQSRCRIRMSAEAKSRIFDVVRDSSEKDGLESGGLLFSYVPTTPDFLEVIGASGFGPAAIRKRHSLIPDSAHQAALILEAEEAGLICCGEWHSHPPGSDGASYRTLSEQDLVVMSRRRALSGAAAYLSVLAVRDAGRWDLQAWVISEGVGRDRAEQAQL